ncbi:MAG: porin, partial [Myxococcota bacterium]
MQPASLGMLAILCLPVPEAAGAARQAATTADIENLRREFNGKMSGLAQENAVLRKRLEEYDTARDAQRTRLDAIELSIDESEGLNAGYEKGFYIKDAEDKHRLTMSGYLQFQGNVFEHNDIPRGARPVFNDGLQGTNRDDTFFIRRARLKFKGHMWTKDLGYVLQIGWDGGSPGLKDAYMDYKWANWARVRFGQFKPPFSLEAQQSSSTIETIERAAIVSVLAMGRRTGIKFYGDVLDKRLTYGIMVANKVGFGNQGRNSPDDNDEKVVIGQVTAMPWKKSGNKWVKGLLLSAAAAHGNNA